MFAFFNRLRNGHSNQSSLLTNEAFEQYKSFKLSEKPDIFQTILARLESNDDTLTEVSFVNLQLEDDDILALCHLLKKNPQIIALDLASNRLSVKSAEIIITLLHLERLNISNNPLGDEGVQLFLRQRSLHELNASLCDLTFTPALVRALAQTKLSSLDLSANSLSFEALRALASNKTIATLYLNACNLDDNTIAIFKNNSRLRKLGLGHNTLGDASVEIFITMNQLTALGLQSNHYTSQGAQRLASSASLEKLDLSCNRIGNRGAQALAMNSMLTHLNLETNNITKRGVALFQTNLTLQTILLNHNEANEDEVTAILCVREHALSEMSVAVSACLV